MKRRSVTFWAWTASIAIHLILLVVFGVTKFSQATVFADQATVAKAKINQVKKVAESSPIIPKPKIRKSTDKIFVKKLANVQTANEILQTNVICLSASPDLSEVVAGNNQMSLAGGIESKGVEFFGSWSNERKICYLVDCSGSMKGLFKRVGRELKNSL